MAKNSITLAVITPGSLLDRGSHIGECHATVWRMPRNRLANAMQPCGERRNLSTDDARRQVDIHVSQRMVNACLPLMGLGRKLF